MLLGGTTQTKAPQFLGVTFLALIAGGKKEGGGTKKLIEVLAKAFIIMFKKKSRLELQMQFAKAKINILNGGDSG
jgi:hypothetical protein